MEKVCNKILSIMYDCIVTNKCCRFKFIRQKINTCIRFVKDEMNMAWKIVVFVVAEFAVAILLDKAGCTVDTTHGPHMP